MCILCKLIWSWAEGKRWFIQTKDYWKILILFCFIDYGIRCLQRPVAIYHLLVVSRKRTQEGIENHSISNPKRKWGFPFVPHVFYSNLKMDLQPRFLFRYFIWAFVKGAYFDLNQEDKWNNPLELQHNFIQRNHKNIRSIFLFISVTSRITLAGLPCRAIAYILLHCYFCRKTFYMKDYFF